MKLKDLFIRIKPTELSDAEYLGTFTGQMHNVTETADVVVDIWPYVKRLVKDEVVSKEVYGKRMVSMVYENANSAFHHVLLPTDNKNIFTVIILDLGKKIITGHYILDLEKKYGIRE